MGQLVNGKWIDVWYDTVKTQGQFKREPSQCRDWVSADGSSGFKAEKNRYHLYVSYACPWAHRTLIFRKLKGLESIIGLSVVSPVMLENGWEFSNNQDCIPDSINQCQYLRELYCLHDLNYTGRVTVPVLWDKQKKCIVNNESSEIIRMLNSVFNDFTDIKDDYYPVSLQKEIDEINQFVYSNINNGVYKCGFATEQCAYNEAFENLFSAIEEIEARLASQTYLVGEQVTEADWRLFTTLIRFDCVYYTHFKCNKQHIHDYPNLRKYLKRLFYFPGIKETVNFSHIKTHYFVSHKTINPSGIIPKGPDLSLLGFN